MDLMTENGRLREIVRCSIELLDVKGELLDLQRAQPTEAQQMRSKQLEERKKQLLHQVSSL